MKHTLSNIITCLLLLFATQILFAQATNAVITQLRQDVKDLKQANRLTIGQLTEQDIKELKKAHSNAITAPLKQDIKDLKKADSLLEIEIQRQKTNFLTKIDEDQDSIAKLKTQLQNTNNVLHQLILKVAAIENKVNQKQKAFDETTGKNNVYWVTAVLLNALLSVLLFNRLRKKSNQK